MVVVVVVLLSRCFEKFCQTVTPCARNIRLYARKPMTNQRIAELNEGYLLVKALYKNRY